MREESRTAFSRNGIRCAAGLERLQEQDRMMASCRNQTPSTRQHVTLTLIQITSAAGTYSAEAEAYDNCSHHLNSPHAPASAWTPSF